MSDNVEIPGIADLLSPVLRAMHDLGGSAARTEIMDQVVSAVGLTDEQIEAVYAGPTGQSKALHRLGWAIYWLKAIGAFDSTERGIYTMTAVGNKYLDMDEVVADAELRKAYDGARKLAGRRAAETRAAKEKSTSKDDAEPIPEDDWKSALIAILKKMKPEGFERLAKLLLREAGFQKVEVVGRSGDGGLDGVGLYRMSLVSFPIYFQCKRYAGGVGASVVRDFRGAMVGRGDKGLIITTGTFTPAARKEATRDGAPPIDLIDGDELCELIAKYRVGVDVTKRTVKEVKVNDSYFDTI